jgi:hypothetical protein
VELLAKAYLATIENALLTERGDRDSLLLMTGHQALTRTLPSGVRTLGAADALAHCRQIKPTLLFEADPTKHVCLRVRNSAAHMALVDRRELTAGVVQMVRYISALLDVLELEPEKFWGEGGFDAVSSLLDKAKSEMQQRVAIKLTVAKRNLALLIATLPEEQVEVVLKAIASRGPLTHIDHHEIVDCPVCNRQAYLICIVERGPLEFEPDGEHNWGGPYVNRTAYPQLFECMVCRLELEADELEEFDFLTEIELEPDTDPREIRDWEPDEDYLRDR